MNKFVRQAKLPQGAYESSYKGLTHYINEENNKKRKDWCRICTHLVSNERVIEFSLKKYGEVRCFICQKKSTDITNQ